MDSNATVSKYLDRIISIKRRNLFRDANGLDNFFIIDVEGNVQEFINQVCMAGLYGLEPESEIYALVTYPFAKCDRELPANKKWIDWMLNESVWARVFRTKSVSVALRRGVVCRTHYDYAFVLQAAMMLRMVSEAPDFVASWAKFSDYCHPYVAMMLAEDFSVSEQDDFLCPARTISNWGHVPYDARLTYCENIGELIGGRIRMKHDNLFADNPGFHNNICGAIRLRGRTRANSNTPFFIEKKERIERKVFGNVHAFTGISTEYLKPFTEDFISYNGIKV